MTDLIALAKQAGMIGAPVEIDDENEVLLHAFTLCDLQAFDDLIRKDEREQCAVACEEVGMWPSLGPRHCAESIRARTTT